MAIDYLRNSLLAMLVALTACAASTTPTNNTDSHCTDSLFIEKWDFVDREADTLYDPSGTLAPFFAALNAIQNEGATVPIIHFGDSHIQGGSISAVVMRRFARDYGSAGRGFITPHKLNGRNEPIDYSITASPSAKGGLTIIEPESRNVKMGISGVAAPCPRNGELTIRYLAQATDETDFKFRRIVAFHDSLAPIISVANQDLADDAGGSDIFNSYSTELNLLNATDSIVLTTAVDGAFADGSIYGFSLENGDPGVIYHSMGVNGACFLHWGRQKNIATQAASLLPELIIISLGSNEAAGNNYIERVFFEQMDSFIDALRAENPTVPILLTTPAEAMRRRGGTQTPNANFALMAPDMKRYAESRGVALFDLFTATSGIGSAQKWRDAELMGRDGVHYTVEGYTLQGLLLYRAIENEAKKYRNR